MVKSADPGRNIVLCLDGTNNEPETGITNVARLFSVVIKDGQQLAYYDPGVGTMGSRAAVTSLGKIATRFAGLVAGFGVKENLEEAYTFLMRHYQSGDQLFVFGFSRGAYTARALTGMLRTVGLLRPGAENLVPYALKLYAQSGSRHATPEQERQFWKLRQQFREQFGNPAFPDPFALHPQQVHFLGVWDTVKAVGWLNWKAQIEQARWPFTAKISNVATARHALAIDEHRRPYKEYRFNPASVAEPDGQHQEMWFAGAHSDVGGQFSDDHRLSDIAFGWMVDEAMTAGLRVDPKRYSSLIKATFGEPGHIDGTVPKIHANGLAWSLLGWRNRPILSGDMVHQSVLDRIEHTSGGSDPYSPKIP